MHILSRPANSQRRPYTSEILEVLQTGSRRGDIVHVTRKCEELEAKPSELLRKLMDEAYETPTGAAESCRLAFDGGDEGTAKVNAATIGM